MGRYNYTNAFNKLTTWAIKEGYEVILDHDDISEITWHRDTLNNPRAIKIEAKWSIEMKVYLMLHELGHHQLRKDWGGFTKSLPILANAEYRHMHKNDSKHKRKVDYKVACMEEEFKAWDEGYKLAGVLGVRINDKKWYDFKTKCLLGYMRFYAKN